MCNNIKCNTVSCSCDFCLVTWVSSIVTHSRVDCPTPTSSFFWGKSSALTKDGDELRCLYCTRMEKRYISGCLSDCFYSLLHIWALNYSCWKWTEIYSELDRISDWAWSPGPPLHTAMEPRTHMGAIICKVAVEAPGNNFESVCVCLCAPWNMRRAHEYLLAIIAPSHLKWVAGRKCAVSRRRCQEIIVFFKSQTLPPTLCSLKKDYLLKALE